MSAGKYRHIVAFQYPVESRVNGLLVRTWEPAKTNSGYPLTAVRAQVLTGPGKQLLAAGSTHNEVSARINLRWFPGLSASWRIIHDGVTYDITGTSTDSTGRREWRLICKAGVSNG